MRLINNAFGLRSNFDKVKVKIETEIKYLIFNAYRTFLIPIISPRSEHKFIFILGCYNSGTTLLNVLLGNHEDISILHTEGAALTKQLYMPEHFGWSRMWHMCSDKLEICKLEKKADAAFLKKEWAFWFDSRKKLWLEKSIVNSLNIDWFEEHFDHPYFIWILRNGYAVSEGIRRRTMFKNKQQWYYPQGYPIGLCARQWVISNQIIEEKLKNVRNHIKITYEDLTEDPRGALERIIGWLPTDQRHVDIPRTFKFHKKEQEIRNMNAESIKRLSTEQIASVNSIARYPLQRYGYKVLEAEE